MKHLTGYIWEIRFLPLTTSINEEGEVLIYIDGANATCIDGKRYSVILVTIGKVATLNISKKLSIVTTSSTETEVVANGERFTKHS